MFSCKLLDNGIVEIFGLINNRITWKICLDCIWHCWLSWNLYNFTKWLALPEIRMCWFIVIVNRVLIWLHNENNWTPSQSIGSVTPASPATIKWYPFMDYWAKSAGIGNLENVSSKLVTMTAWNGKSSVSLLEKNLYLFTVSITIHNANSWIQVILHEIVYPMHRLSSLPACDMLTGRYEHGKKSLLRPWNENIQIFSVEPLSSWCYFHLNYL